MDTSDAAAIERAWLDAVNDALDTSAVELSDTDVRALLRVTKIVADVTGVRYLAPLTSYLLGVAAGRSTDVFELRSAVDRISALAEGWTPPADRG